MAVKNKTRLLQTHFTHPPTLPPNNRGEPKRQHIHNGPRINASSDNRDTAILHTIVRPSLVQQPKQPEVVPDPTNSAMSSADKSNGGDQAVKKSEQGAQELAHGPRAKHRVTRGKATLEYALRPYRIPWDTLREKHGPVLGMITNMLGES